MVVDERHIKQARSRRRMLDKMDRIDKVSEARTMRLALDGHRGSRKAVQLKDLVYELPDGRVLWWGLNATIWHGERVGLVGPNGAGKSMLLRTVLDPAAQEAGSVVIGPSCVSGYYAQEHENLDYGQTPLALVRNQAAMREEAVVAFLNRFLFSYDQVRSPIANLSGGERSRLQLACLVLRNPNLLLLDEPTNNLDIPSIEVLEATLAEFEGAVIVVSHDRYFLDSVVDRVLELKDGELRTFDGGYSDYLEASAA
jgi:ATP-binding cassette subfamily F protein 3